MKTPKSILVTGFQPFLGESINPSSCLIDFLREENFADVETLLLPVSFQSAPHRLIHNLQMKDYDFILLLGQAGGRSKVCLERIAVNWIETEHADEDKFMPVLGPIEEGGPGALFTSLPLTEWKRALEKRNLSVEISLSAGGFVCNHLYYQTLRWLSLQGKRTEVCFVHVPYISEQVVNKPGLPSMEIVVMRQILIDLLQLCRNF